MKSIKINRLYYIIKIKAGKKGKNKTLLNFNTIY